MAITLKNKVKVLEHLDFLTSAPGKINHCLIKLSTIGIFAIVASTAGTMAFDELAKMKVSCTITGYWARVRGRTSPAGV